VYGASFRLAPFHEKVLDDGYRPLPLRQFPMPKPDGRSSPNINRTGATTMKTRLLDQAMAPEALDQA